MKKHLSVLLSMAILTGSVSAVLPITASAQDNYEQPAAESLDIPTVSESDTAETEYIYERDTNTYKYVILDDGTVKIKEATCHSHDVYVPSVINGRKVTVIGDSAFTGNQAYSYIDENGNVVDNLRKVIIPEGVKVIEAYAFFHVDRIQEIQLPDSLEEIGHLSFSNTNAFKDLVLPKSLKKIAFGAFNECESITSVVMPDSLTKLSDAAFANCTGLVEVTVSGKADMFEKEPFTGCVNIQSFKVKNNSKNYSALNGVLYNSDKTELLMYPQGKTGGFVMPNTVNSVREYAFKDSKISSIIFSSSLEKVGKYAFRGCSELTGKLILPNSLRSIGDDSFWGCTGITELYLGDKTNYESLADCFTSLQSISVSENNPKYISLDGVLYSSDKTTICGYPSARTGVFTVPDGITTVAPGAFFYASLGGVVLPDSVTALLDGAFAESSIQYIEFSKNLEIIDDDCFHWCDNLRILSGNVSSLKKIGNSAFAECAALEGIGELQSIEYIGYSAFWGCTSLKSIRITSEKLDKIDYMTFAECTNLSYMELPYRLTSIDEKAFYECPNLLVYCYVNSYAHKYVDEHGIMYTLIPVTLCGDLNKDYRVTASDALKALRISVGAELSDEYLELVGDVNGDGKITASDALIVLRYSVGAEGSEKVGMPI